MNAAPTTLYADWVRRRERLDREDGTISNAFRLAQIRILDYLLKRYIHDPAAQKPALFPLRVDVHLNQRATVVHAHLLGRMVTQTTDDATQRVSPVLQRIAAVKAQEFARAPSGGSPVSLGDIKPGLRAWIPLLGFFDDWIITRAWDCLQRDPMLPDDLVQTLCKRLYDRRVTPILKRCSNPSAAEYCADMWLRAANVAAAEAVLVAPQHRAAALRILREKLADPEELLRIRALRLLAFIGTLEDVGLLLDLHALPMESYDTPYEREQIVATAAAISQRVEREATAESTGIHALWR